MSTNRRACLSAEDRELLALWARTDSDAAHQYELHLRAEARANDRFYGRQVRCEPNGVVALRADEDFMVTAFVD